MRWPKLLQPPPPPAPTKLYYVATKITYHTVRGDDVPTSSRKSELYYYVNRF